MDAKLKGILLNSNSTNHDKVIKIELKNSEVNDFLEFIKSRVEVKRTRYGW